MAARRAQRIRSVAHVVDVAVNDPTTQRALDGLRSQLERVSARPDYQVLEVDLAVGANRVEHGLGRKPLHVSLMPVTADATFAWGVSSRDARVIIVDLVGVAQTNATILVM